MATRTNAQRRKEAIRIAGELYNQEPNWTMFFRDILGLNGVVRTLFPSATAMATFQRSSEYQEILAMCETLRTGGQRDDEPTRVITVRLPKSLHETLREEAHERRTSINKLCITKLMRLLAEETT